MPYSPRELIEAADRFIGEMLPGCVVTGIDLHLHGRPDPLHIPIPPYYQRSEVRGQRSENARLTSDFRPLTSGAVEDEKPSARHPMIPRCIQDILATLRAAGRPLTKFRLLEEMVKQGFEWSESAVTHYLQVLMDDGSVENPTEAKPRGYRCAAG